MEREYNTDSKGRRWTRNVIDAVWEKAMIIDMMDPRLYRQDRLGNWIISYDFGKQGRYGWEIDHILPVSINGGDDLENLQPLAWKVNREKGETYPWSPSSPMTESPETEKDDMLLFGDYLRHKV